MIIKRFDVHEFVKKSVKLGVSEPVAELQARELEKITDVIHNQQVAVESLRLNDPATKKNLEVTKLELRKEMEVIRKEIEVVRGEIKETANKLLIWMFSTMTLYSGVLVGVMAKGFHWL